MAIFSKSKGNKAQKAAAPEEPAGPVERVMYVPKYAVRDAMQCTPSGEKREHKDALRKAHEARAIKEEYERGLQQYALSNPKLAISRNSSPPSTLYNPSRMSQPSVSGSSSCLSIPSLAHTNPPMPTIPQQYASSSSSSAGPSTPSLSRSSSHHTRAHIHSLEAQLQVPLKSRSGYAQWNNSAASVGSAPAPMAKTAYRTSYGSQNTPTSMIGETPLEASEEADHSLPSLSSNASTTSSATGDAEVLEIHPRYDSTQSSPVLEQSERFYPHDPRKLGKAPVITSMEVTQLAPSSPPVKQYFSHAANPATKAPVVAPPAPEQKKSRFSFIRRGQAVSAH